MFKPDHGLTMSNVGRLNEDLEKAYHLFTELTESTGGEGIPVDLQYRMGMWQERMSRETR